MAAELHIDIYSIVLGHVSLIVYMLQLSKLIVRVKDEKLRKALDKLLVDYSGALGPGDLIIWPVILTVIYPFYAIIVLLIKGSMVALVKNLFGDMSLLKINILLLLLWLTTTLFALLHWFVFYTLLFIIGIIILIVLNKKTKQITHLRQGVYSKRV